MIAALTAVASSELFDRTGRTISSESSGADCAVLMEEVGPASKRATGTQEGTNKMITEAGGGRTLEEATVKANLQVGIPGTVPYATKGDRGLDSPTDLNYLATGVRFRDEDGQKREVGSEGPESLDLARLARNRRRLRLARFVFAEAVALAVLAGSVLAGISERFSAESLTSIFKVVPILAATAATVLPILFFGHPKRRGRLRPRGPFS